MTRLIATALSAVTVLYLGIHALSFRETALSGQTFTGANETALNLTRNVTSDGMAIVGNAMPRLLMIVMIVMVIMMLLMIR